MSLLRARYLLASSRNFLCRSYATPTSPSALVLLEHRHGLLENSSLSALTAAQQLGGEVTAVIVGQEDHVQKAVSSAKKLRGVTSILHSSSPQYNNPLPEAVAPLLLKLLSESPQFTHVVSSTSSFAKSLLPRVAAQLDAPAITDVTSVDHDNSSHTTTFTRPIYAGNAIATVRATSAIPIKFFTARSTAFVATAEHDGAAVTSSLDPVPVPDCPAEHLRAVLSKSDRPELGVANRVVSGGRALKNAETFASTLYPLADALGAAVGASRAAVDAGYADNSLQVGQTGKVVAPELYMAVGISGAIQHLAGMKDSKLIVAINKDPDAPIFQVADFGLVADLFEAVPDLTRKLKA